MPLNIFEYQDYRRFLSDYIQAKEDQKGHFSRRAFTLAAGLGSSGYLKMVMDGQRNLSAKSILKFIQALKLGNREASYFEALVMYSQSTQDKARESYFRRMNELRPTVKLRGISPQQQDYFRYRYFVIIREMVALPHFQEDMEWIASRINPPIRAEEAAYAIESLIKLGLLQRDAQGRLVQKETSLTTPHEYESAALYHLHQVWLKLAQEAYAKFPVQKRDFSALTIPIPAKEIPELKKLINEFREKIIEHINRGTTDYEDVYQVNIQLFPVTQTK